MTQNPNPTLSGRRALKRLISVGERAEEIASGMSGDVGQRFSMAAKSDMGLFAPAALSALGVPMPTMGDPDAVPRETDEEVIRFTHYRRLLLAALGQIDENRLAAHVSVPGGGEVRLAEWLIAWETHTSGLLGVVSDP